MAYPYRSRFFQKCPEYIPPTSEEDAQTDPRTKLKPPCEKKCHKYTKIYDECVERITKRNELIANGESDLEPGHCLGQHYDFISCVDHCVAKDLFRYLK